MEAKGRKDHTTIDDLDLLGAAFQGNVEKMEELILGGGDIAVTDNMGSTLLHFATSAGNHDMVELLLEKGAGVDINERNYLGAPLHKAAENGHEAVVKILLQRGADINVKDYFQDTPLHVAAENGQEAVVKILLQHGADINVKNYLQRTPLHVATENRHEAVVKLLLQHGANSQKAIGGAAKKGIDIDATDRFSGTALYMAAKTGNRAIVQLLIEEGADIEAADFDLETPLSAALKNSHMDVVKLLREKEAHFGEGE